MESSSELTGVTSWAKIIEPLTFEKRGGTTSLASGTADHLSQAPGDQGTAKPSVLSSEAEPFVPRRFPQIMPSKLYEAHQSNVMEYQDMMDKWSTVASFNDVTTPQLSTNIGALPSKNDLVLGETPSIGPHGLPLRPWEKECRDWETQMVCRHGPYCIFNHSWPPQSRSSHLQH
ncbi:unnamed protein product [Sphagnum troendelagicum]|uniref:C3H1-type domain-containing protein n=1 Tax=Sphagnum troendelagicum TaxID=128251 RepID=A0ABP0UVF1_9BRYO